MSGESELRLVRISITGLLVEYQRFSGTGPLDEVDFGFFDYVDQLLSSGELVRLPGLNKSSDYYRIVRS